MQYFKDTQHLENYEVSLQVNAGLKKTQLVTKVIFNRYEIHNTLNTISFNVIAYPSKEKKVSLIYKIMFAGNNALDLDLGQLSK